MKRIWMVLLLALPLLMAAGCHKHVDGEGEHRCSHAECSAEGHHACGGESCKKCDGEKKECGAKKECSAKKDCGAHECGAATCEKCSGGDCPRCAAKKECSAKRDCGAKKECGAKSDCGAKKDCAAKKECGAATCSSCGAKKSSECTGQSKEKVCEGGCAKKDCARGLPAGGAERAKALIGEMIATVGSMDDLKAHGDVEFTYTYGSPETGEVDISTERYVFEGEKSWARYETHAKNVFPGQPGVVEQGFDGTTSWTTVDGVLVEDLEAVKLADFLRKTNFYWTVMMQKLMDPGLTYSYDGTREVDGVAYEIVTVGFEPGVGDVADTYVLYLNPETKLVDRFLFTVMDFGVETPLLMLVEYEEVGCEVLLPVRRRYAPSNWEGEVVEESWTHEISEDFRWGNGFEDALFEAPAS